MTSPILKYLLFFCTCFLTAQGFWWNKLSTTTESPTVLRHIPLTYFRTYTYQPATPYNLPFYNAGGYSVPPQTPLLAGARFDHYYGPHSVPFNGIYSGDPMLQDAGLPFRTMKSASSSSSTTTTTTTTPAPTTTTTTTTTTTPPPTTTTSSTSSSTTPPRPTTISPFHSYEYPTYNRRFYMHNYGSNFYRPPYPYPEYSIYNAPPVKSTTGFGGAHPPQIQFVPCMCPVTIGEAASAQYFPQARSNRGVLGEKPTDDEILALQDDNDKTALRKTEFINTGSRNVREDRVEQPEEKADEAAAVIDKFDDIYKREDVKSSEAVQQQEAPEELEDVD